MAIPLVLFALLTLLFQPSLAIRMLESKSLNPCMENSALVATYFHMVFTPTNQTLTFQINGDSQVSTNVVLDVRVTGYGYNVFSKTIYPCDSPDLKGLCPMSAGSLPNVMSNAQMPSSQISRVPNIVYYIPDLDGQVRVWINSTETGKPLACVETDLSNGKSVHQVAAAWALVVLTTLFLSTSATLWIRGYFNSSSHLVAKTICLVNYYQSLGLIGMTAVHTPPIVRAWTQNCLWSMGIVRVGFLQRLATWYLRATGGKPADLFSSSTLTSVRILKRTNSRTYAAFNQNKAVVNGINRVSYLANIEITNFFMTGYMWFIILVILLVGAAAVSKCSCELLLNKRKLNSERVHECRRCWRMYLKGMLFRLVLLCFAPMVVLCIWEVTRRDSPAEAVLAMVTIVCTVSLLSYATYRAVAIARLSFKLHRNPAYLLYSDNHVLSKWGFLFTQYRASSVSFIIPALVHQFIKGGFCALAQSAQVVQAIAFFVLDLIFVAIVTVFRPYMDSTTNIFAIAVSAMMLMNSTLLLLYSNIFALPPLAIGTSGILFFFANLVFMAATILVTLVTAIRALTACCCGTASEPCIVSSRCLDDRASFIRTSLLTSAPSTTGFETQELAALGATARCDLPREKAPHDGTDPAAATWRQASPVEVTGHTVTPYTPHLQREIFAMSRVASVVPPTAIPSPVPTVRSARPVTATESSGREGKRARYPADWRPGM